jgi:hypothetical protein
MKNMFYIAALAIALLAVVVAPAHSQGLIVRGGMNFANASTDPEIEDKEFRLGFNASVLGDLPATDLIHLLAGVGYEQRGLRATFAGEETVFSGEYLTVPILLSLRSPSATPGRPSMRFFLNLGVEPAFLLDADWDVGDFDFELGQAEDFDFGLRGEAGVELPFAAAGPGAIAGVGYTYGLTDANSDSGGEWHNYAIQVFIGLKLGRF